MKKTLFTTCNPLKIKYPYIYVQKESEAIKITIFFLKDKGLSFHLPIKLTKSLMKILTKCLEE